MQDTVTLPHGIAPDEFGVYNGLEMARAIMAHAFSFVTPYVQGCPEHAVCLFHAIASETIQDLLAEAAAEGGLLRRIATIHEPGPRGRALVDGHLAASVHETLRLMQRMGQVDEQDEDSQPRLEGW